MYDLETCTIGGRHSFLLEYLREIKAGNIIIGHELQQQLDNLIVDLDNPDYYYDNRNSDFRIEFVETFCKHTKSPFAGMPFKLMLWEKALIEAFYSFRRTKNGRRRFRKLILLIARKNGKSTLAAALCLTEFMVGGAGIDCLCTSNDDAEAGIIFNEIANMREKSKAILKRTNKNLTGIYGNSTKNTIKKLTVRTGAKEGRNVDFAIVDEAHEMADNTMVKPVEQSQSTKPEPVLIIITTEGFINGGYLDDELAKARKILAGELDDDSTLIWLYTQDSEAEIWQNENSWYKANPSLGEVKTWEYMRGQIRDAQISKKDRAFTLAKDYNIKQGRATAWLTPQEYSNPITFAERARALEIFNEEGKPDLMKYLRGCKAVGGVDLAETTDLACARAMVMHSGDPFKYMLTQYFVPETKQELHDDNMDYIEWARRGLVTICPGADVDFELIYQWYVDLVQQHEIMTYYGSYDGYHAKEWAKKMKDTGFEGWGRLPQDHIALSMPMNLLEQDLKAKLIIYDANPADEWCLSNTALDLDKYGRIKPKKVEGKAINRIDGTATMIDCYGAFIEHKSDFMRMVG